MAVLLGLCVLVISIAWYAFQNRSESSKSVPITGIEFKMTDSELTANTQLAEAGKVDATLKLMSYYGIYLDSENDFLYWKRKLVKLAKAGNEDARRSLPSWETEE